MLFALKPESFERLSKSGVNGAMSLEAPPGAYRLPSWFRRRYKAK